VFCVSVKVKLTVPLLYVCVHSAWKGRPRNDLYCVGWDVKPYSLTHSLSWRWLGFLLFFVFARIVNCVACSTVVTQSTSRTSCTSTRLWKVQCLQSIWRGSCCIGLGGTSVKALQLMPLAVRWVLASSVCLSCRLSWRVLCSCSLPSVWRWWPAIAKGRHSHNPIANQGRHSQGLP